MKKPPKPKNKKGGSKSSSPSGVLESQDNRKIETDPKSLHKQSRKKENTNRYFGGHGKRFGHLLAPSFRLSVYIFYYVSKSRLSQASISTRHKRYLPNC